MSASQGLGVEASGQATTPAKKESTATASTPLSAHKFRRGEDDENLMASFNVASPLSASAALPGTIDAVTTPLRNQVRRALGETERLRVEAERLATKLVSRSQAHELDRKRLRAALKERKVLKASLAACNDAQKRLEDQLRAREVLEEREAEAKARAEAAEAKAEEAKAGEWRTTYPCATCFHVQLNRLPPPSSPSPFLPSMHHPSSCLESRTICQR